MNHSKALSTLNEWLSGKATGVRYSELASTLRALGWQESGGGGSHRIWWHEDCQAVIQSVDKGTGQLLPVYVKRAAKVALAQGREK